MNRLILRFSGGAALLIGVVHLLVGWGSYEQLTFDALWFGGSGLAVILIGTLSLLCSSDRAWRALATAALAANLGGLALAAAFGVLSDWSQPQGPILGAIFLVGSLGCAQTLRR
jgi:hypothetical protein